MSDFNPGYEPTDIDSLPTYSESEVHPVLRDQNLMAHVRGIADQLHDHGMCLQFVEGYFIVRDREWVERHLTVNDRVPPEVG